MDAYNEGWNAYNDCVILADCPYFGEPRLDWFQGWYDARSLHMDTIYGE